MKAIKNKNAHTKAIGIFFLYSIVTFSSCKNASQTKDPLQAKKGSQATPSSQVKQGPQTQQGSQATPGSQTTPSSKVKKDPAKQDPQTSISVTEKMIQLAKKKNCIFLANMLRKLQAGEEVNVQNTDTGHHHETALHAAVQLGELDVVKLLLQLGADVNAKTAKDNATPIHKAIEKKQLGVIKILLEHEQIDLNAEIQIKRKAYTPLHMAVHKGRLEIVETLLKHHNNVSIEVSTINELLIVAQKKLQEHSDCQNDPKQLNYRYIIDALQDKHRFISQNS